jgi:hypothetical protein
MLWILGVYTDKPSPTHSSQSARRERIITVKFLTQILSIVIPTTIKSIVLEDVDSIIDAIRVTKVIKNII